MFWISKPASSTSTASTHSTVTEQSSSYEDAIPLITHNHYEQLIQRPLSRCRSNSTTMRILEDYKFTHLQCPFCRRLMGSDRNPILLECGHSFCRDCVLLMPVFECSLGHGTLWSEKVDENGCQSIKSGSSSRCSDNGNYETTVKGERSVTDLLASLLFARYSKQKQNEDEDYSSNGNREGENFFDAQSDGDDDSAKENNVEYDISVSNDDEHDDYQKRSFGYIRCLDCRHKTQLQKDGIDDMEMNVLLAAAADKAAYKMSVCADCGTAGTKTYCEECSLYLCQPCSKRIHSGMITSLHNIIDFDHDSEILPQSVLSPSCPHHPKEESVLYCVTCGELACVLCAYGTHKQHDISLLTDAISTLKHRLRQKSKNTSDKLLEVISAKANIKQEVYQLKENSVAAKAFICKRIDEIKQVIIRLEHQMCTKVDQEYEQKNFALNKQESELTALEADLRLRIHLAGAVIQNPNAAEMIEPTNRQIQTLQSSLNEVPDLGLCTSAEIKVSTQILSKSLNSLSSQLDKDGFPRDPATIRALAVDITDNDGVMTPQLARRKRDISRQQEEDEELPEEFLTAKAVRTGFVSAVFESPLQGNKLDNQENVKKLQQTKSSTSSTAIAKKKKAKTSDAMTTSSSTNRSNTSRRTQPKTTNKRQAKTVSKSKLGVTMSQPVNPSAFVVDLTDTDDQEVLVKHEHLSQLQQKLKDLGDTDNDSEDFDTAQEYKKTLLSKKQPAATARKSRLKATTSTGIVNKYPLRILQSVEHYDDTASEVTQLDNNEKYVNNNDTDANDTDTLPTLDQLGSHK